MAKAAKKKTKKELSAVAKKLEEERESLLKQLTDLERRTFEGSQADPNESGTEDYADAGSDTFERERDFSLAENLKDLVAKVEHALEKTADGTYGICESCGKPIEAARLKALPYATLCIDCKRREERR